METLAAKITLDSSTAKFLIVSAVVRKVSRETMLCVTICDDVTR